MRVTPPRSKTRRPGIPAVAALIAITLSGCTPTPEPTPSPTPAFASEEEAFAAAEKVYRAYMAAFNDVDFRLPTTFEPLSGYTAGSYERDERELLSQMHAAQHVRGGAIEIIEFSGVEVTEHGEVFATTCNDVSSTTYLDEEGRNLVPADRAARYALELVFSLDETGLRLTEATTAEDPSCAE